MVVQAVTIYHSIFSSTSDCFHAHKLITNWISTRHQAPSTNTGIRTGIGISELVSNRLQYQIMNMSLMEFHYLWICELHCCEDVIFKNVCISWYNLETIWRQFYSNDSYHQIKRSLMAHMCGAIIIKWKSIQCKYINKCVNSVE